MSTATLAPEHAARGDVSISTEPRAETPAREPAHAKDRSEVEFLRIEAERAKAAIVGKIDELKTTLKEAADIKLWAERHPWGTVAVAAVAGFTAATALVPKPADHSEPAVAEPQAPAAAATATPALATVLMTSLVELAKSFVEKSIAGNPAAAADVPQPGTPTDSTAAFDGAHSANVYQ